MLDFTVIIPARFSSSRLPGKPLLDIHGLPMIIRVLQQAKCAGAQRVIVATDHIEIKKIVEQYGGEVCMTSADHQSGTERLAEVVNNYQISDETIIVNVQGDEPLIPPIIIQQVAENLAYNKQATMATLATPIDSVLEINDPNVVKVVLDNQGYALYFSRAPIPWDRDQTAKIGALPYLRHIGIYAYRASAIREYITLPETQLEQLEKLEQLKLLWHKKSIHVALAKETPPTGVDTLEDLLKVNRLLSR